jgi:hypothetical protein
MALLLATSIPMSAQTIYPACVSVASDGTIAIKMTESFSKVFTSPDFNGPYSQVPASEMTMVGQTIFFDDNVTLNGNAGVHWFYFESTVFNDTIANIFLELSGPSTGEVTLEWNLSFGSGASFDDNGVEFIIQWDYPNNSAWSEFQRVPLNLNKKIYDYTYIVDICGDSLNFRITLDFENADGTDCDFFSNEEFDYFEDLTSPETPVIKWVSVDTASGFAMLSWITPIAPDLAGFIIYDHLVISNEPIDTINNAAVTSYIDISSSPDIDIYDYAIAAFDTCPNTSIGGEFTHLSEPTADDQIQHTILVGIEFSECDSALDLSWNKYDNWPDGVKRYEVWKSENGNAYSFVEQVDSTVTAYSYSPVDPNIDYCFFIKAIDGSELLRSFSNIRCKLVDYTNIPDSIYLTEVNTDFRYNGNNELTLYVEGGLDVDMQGFVVEAKYPNRDYIEIGFLPFTGDSLYYFVDIAAGDFDDVIWYRVLEIDVCGLERLYSNMINSIHLEVITDNIEAINTLVWNEALGRAGEIVGYRLYRLHESTGDLDSVVFRSDGFQNFYTDNLSGEYSEDGSYCYVVEVLEKRDTIIFSNDFSNIACGLIEPRVWIPNAFIIDGSSAAFKPVFAYAELTDYKMYILNRLSEVLFTSDDPEIGWDGFYKGNPVLQGVYVYIIEFRDGNNNLIVEKGTVTVL